MAEPSNAEIMTTLLQVLDVVKTAQETVAGHDAELDAIQGHLIRMDTRLEHIEGATEHTANRVEICIDALGAFRTDYLRRFGPGNAA